MATRFEPLPTPRRTRRSRLLQALALVALLLIATAMLAPRITASASKGPAFPTPTAKPFAGRTLTYRDESGYVRAVAAAARRWNAVGARVRLRAAKPGTDADHHD
jgi:hypothetical protein